MRKVYKIMSTMRGLALGVIFVATFVALGGVGRATTTPGRISGVIKDGISGQPLANVTIDVKNPDTNMLVGTGKTGSNGAYVVNVKAGAGVYNVYITPPISNLLARTEQNVTIGPATIISETLDPETRTISGNVTDGDGNAAANVQVAFQNPAGETFPVTTDDAGDYQTSLPIDENITTLITYKGAHLTLSGTMTVADDMTRNFQVPAVVSLQLQLTDVTGSYPNGELSVAGQNALVAQAGDDTYTQEYPGFSQQFDLPASTTLSVLQGATFARDAICFDFTEAEVCNPTDLTPTADSQNTLELQSLPRYTLSGTITDAQGNPKSGMTIVPNIADGAWSQDVHITDPGAYDIIQTDENGAFTITAPAYTYSLQFRDGVQDPVPLAQVTLPLTSDITHTFQLPPLRTLTIQTEDAAGAPLIFSGGLISSATVAVQSGGDTYDIATYGMFGSSDQGIAQIPVYDGLTIDPSTGSLYVTFGDGEHVDYPFDGPLVITGDATFTFKATATKPQAPSNLTGLTPTTDYPVLTWTAPADATADTQYVLYRNDGVTIGTTNDTTLTDTLWIDPGVHTYYVRALRDGLYSDSSDTMTIDYEPPQ
ncbi:MAG TPA: carboxypeptidase-like regulatory domain-containing protein [Candidatus Saccharimonadales bacterium]|nr:carboxypeptidase-like regulatory domain-containing protein [Candidatus Saccharimonadales bacterium]